MPHIRSLLAVLFLLLSIAAPAVAGQPEDRGPTPGLGWGPGGSKSLAVPAPIAATGIPALIIIGGYVWLRRRRTSRDS